MKKEPTPIRGEFFFHGIRQRPTLPGDFACLNPAQRAAVKILTKYNAAHWLGQSEKKGVALLTLPGDIGPLFRPQGAGVDILTKYVPRSVKDDLGEERCR